MKTLSVLLIEDAEADAKLASMALMGSSVQFDVTIARTLEEGLRYLSKAKPGAIILDLRLPDSEGLDTLSAVTEAADGAAIVVLTSIHDDELGIRALAEGAQDYVVKDDAGWIVLPRTIRYAVERQRLRLELAEANKRLRLFIASAAHELRSPIAVVAGAAQTLADAKSRASPEIVDKLFEALQRQSLRVSEMTNSLLDLSRLMHETPAVEPVDVAAAAEHIVEVNPAPAGRTVTTKVSGGLTAMATEDVVQRILTNLLTNAIRYGGRHITIEGVREGPAVRIVVSDDGDGVPDQLRERLFEHFQRGSQEYPDSSGLGLAIVRQLARSVGGSVEYEPGDPGARFIVELPAAES